MWGPLVLAGFLWQGFISRVNHPEAASGCSEVLTIWMPCRVLPEGGEGELGLDVMSSGKCPQRFHPSHRAARAPLGAAGEW